VGTLNGVTADQTVTAPVEAEPRWLDEREQKLWRSFVAIERLLPDRLAARLTAEHGLTITDYEIMVRLSESEDRRMRMTELSQITLLSKSRLSHQVNRMEAAGIVRREPCDDDRRGSFAVLTDEGFARLQAAAPTHVEDVRTHFIDILDRGTFETVLGELNAIADHLRAIRNLRSP